MLLRYFAGKIDSDARPDPLRDLGLPGRLRHNSPRRHGEERTQHGHRATAVDDPQQSSRRHSRIRSGVAAAVQQVCNVIGGGVLAPFDPHWSLLDSAVTHLVQRPQKQTLG
jgi:hypothetical protein